MKTKLIVMLVLLIPAGGVQAQPYLSASTGTAHIDATGYGSQTRRRDAVAVGQGLTDLFAVEVSYFQIQEARYPLPVGSTQTTIPAAVAVRQKLSGLAVGPVFRWNFLRASRSTPGSRSPSPRPTCSPSSSTFPPAGATGTDPISRAWASTFGR
jgi:hypothetical protein